MAEGKNQYETVIVTSAKLGEDGNAAIVERFTNLIARHGTVQSVDDWGKRRFAYPIQKQTEGYYTLIYFESDPTFTAELDRRYQITDGVLRTLIVKRDPRYLDAQKTVLERTEEPAQTPVEETAAEEAPVEAAPVEEASVEETPAEETPAEETPAEESPAEEAPVEETPAEEAPAETTDAE